MVGADHAVLAGAQSGGRDLRVKRSNVSDGGKTFDANLDDSIRAYPRESSRCRARSQLALHVLPLSTSSTFHLACGQSRSSAADLAARP